MVESHTSTAVESTLMPKHHQDGVKKDLKTFSDQAHATIFFLFWMW